MLINLVASMLVAGSPVSISFGNNKLTSKTSNWVDNSPSFLLNKVIAPNLDTSFSLFFDNNLIPDINYVSGDKVEKKLYFTEVKYDDVVLKLKKEFCVQYYKDEVGYHTEDEKFEIFCYAETIDELRKEINENLVVSWKLYVDCSEDELSEDAKELRNLLLQYMKKV